MPRYEYRDDRSNKFWEIELDGLAVTTRWGRIGSKGQSKTKTLDSEAAAQKEYDRLIKSKVNKGYERAEAKVRFRFLWGFTGYYDMEEGFEDIDDDTLIAHIQSQTAAIEDVETSEAEVRAAFEEEPDGFDEPAAEIVRSLEIHPGRHTVAHVVVEGRPSLYVDWMVELPVFVACTQEQAEDEEFRDLIGTLLELMEHIWPPTLTPAPGEDEIECNEEEPREWTVELW